ncbi:hypothetical protein HN51_022091, partial [Arachis hypogaea]
MAATAIAAAASMNWVVEREGDVDIFDVSGFVSAINQYIRFYLDNHFWEFFEGLELLTQENIYISHVTFIIIDRKSELAVDKLPIIPTALELIGILFTMWFTYQYLLFKPDREELFRILNKSLIGFVIDQGLAALIGFVFLWFNWQPIKSKSSSLAIKLSLLATSEEKFAFEKITESSWINKVVALNSSST